MKQLHEAVKGDKPLVGPFSVSGSATLVEMIGYAGLDFVIIDCEHAATSPYGSELEGLIRAAYAADIAPIVRVSSHERGQLLKALNLGAQAVVVPHVNTAEEARKIVEDAKYAPVGRRSCAPPVRAAKHGFVPWAQFHSEQLAETLLIPLVEERAGVENVAEIAAVDGIDGIFFGPFDLAVSVGDPAGAFDLATHANVREEVYRVAHSAGLFVADLAWDSDSATAMAAMGADIIALGTDLTMFAHSLKELATSAWTVRDQRAG